MELKFIEKSKKNNTVKVILFTIFDNKQELLCIFDSSLHNFVLSDSQNLTAAIDYTGDTYNEIGDMYEKQVRYLKIAQ